VCDVFTGQLEGLGLEGLGLSVVGKESGIYISDIVKGGVAESDGRLMQGDQILTVEHQFDMRDDLSRKVTLTVGRLKAGSRTSIGFVLGGTGSGASTGFGAQPVLDDSDDSDDSEIESESEPSTSRPVKKEEFVPKLPSRPKDLKTVTQVIQSLIRSLEAMESRALANLGLQHGAAATPKGHLGKR